MTTELQMPRQRSVQSPSWDTEFDRIHVWNPAAAKSPTRNRQHRSRQYCARAGSSPPNQFEGG